MKPQRLFGIGFLIPAALLTLLITGCGTSTARRIQVSDADRIASIEQDTPCYAGPGPTYDLVTVLPAGIEVVIIGVGQKGEYVVVQQPDNPDEHCWAALVEITTTEDLMAEFMKLNVGDPDDDAIPNDLIIYLKLTELDALPPSDTTSQGWSAQVADATSTFHPRPPTPTSTVPTPTVIPVSGDMLDLLAPPFTPDPLFGPIGYLTRDTLCWRGPGNVYEVVQALFAGQDVKVIGEDAQQEWYILDSPIYTGASCWVKRDAVTAAPDVVVLTIIPIPPTPTQTPDPGSSNGSPVCVGNLPKPECEAAGGTWSLAAFPQCDCTP